MPTESTERRHASLRRALQALRIPADQIADEDLEWYAGLMRAVLPLERYRDIPELLGSLLWAVQRELSLQLGRRGIGPDRVNLTVYTRDDESELPPLVDLRFVVTVRPEEIEVELRPEAARED